MVDYYRVLGVSRDASSEEIKAAFRRLALKFHPDRHANESKSAQKSASESFREVKEAYEVLGNDRQRDVYNRYSSPGSPYSSAYSSAREARTAYERASQHSRYTSEQKQTTSAGGFKSDWSYKTSYSGRYNRSVRWGWQPPMEGPKLVFRATLFGMAVVTLMMIQPAINSAWRRKNVGKSYEEMLERVRRRKRTDESHS